MVAWRARIGLIKPTHRGKSFAYWYNHAPEGVEIVPTFIGFRSEKRESFLEGFKKAEALAEQLKEVGCDIISVSGTPPFLLKGLDYERQWAAITVAVSCARICRSLAKRDCGNRMKGSGRNSTKLSAAASISTSCRASPRSMLWTIVEAWVVTCAAVPSSATRCSRRRSSRKMPPAQDCK